MLSNRKLSKIIDVVYWAIILINAGYNEVVTVIKDFGDITAEFPSIAETYGEFLAWTGFVVSGVMIYFFFVLLAMIKYFYLTVLYFGSKFANRSFQKDKIDKTDKKSDEYYRDILPDMSPGVLSYIDDFKINENDVVATIMMLEQKGKLRIADKIEVINDSEDDLNKNEKYILKCMKSEDNHFVNMAYFEDQVIKDAVENKLLKENKDIKKSVIKKIIVNVITYIVGMTIGFEYYNIIEMIRGIGGSIAEGIALVLEWLSGLVIFIMFVGVILYPPIFIVYISKYYSKNKKNPYIRNKKAIEINKKLEGLKVYIKDFSNMEDRTKEETVLWKEYLIYSVMFEQNTKITNEILEIITK